MQVMTKFWGREQELQDLSDLLNKNSSSLIVIRGRRRIGKTRLAEEFSKAFPKHYIFTGLPPRIEDPTADSERGEFRRQMHENRIESFQVNDWGDLFSLVAKHCQRGRVLVVLDEITWMGSKDPDFLGKLKIAWDLYFKKNPKLILIISGSNSCWIEKNIISSTGFMGRISLHLTLEELPLNQCVKFWGAKQSLISSYEKFKVLGVTGGIPRYLEEILPEKTAEQNIFRLCFVKKGILFYEFDNIFTDLFNGRHAKYREIMKCLSNGPSTLEKLTRRLGRIKGGDISEAIQELEETGFLARDYTWRIHDGMPSKLSQIRIRDNYIRFYLRYIEPKKLAISKGTLKTMPISWLSIMGLQFENLILNNLNRIIELLKIPSHEIVTAGPYFQTKTTLRKKCQIDLMIQTKYHQLYVCEVKFEQDEIKEDIIQEVEEKIKNLDRPRGFSCRPVLIHVNGVKRSVIETEFFSQIIDFTEFLK